MTRIMLIIHHPCTTGSCECDGASESAASKNWILLVRAPRLFYSCQTVGDKSSLSVTPSPFLQDNDNVPIQQYQYQHRSFLRFLAFGFVRLGLGLLFFCDALLHGTQDDAEDGAQHVPVRGTHNDGYRPALDLRAAVQNQEQLEWDHHGQHSVQPARCQDVDRCATEWQLIQHVGLARHCARVAGGGQQARHVQGAHDGMPRMRHDVGAAHA
mmetsp:Transcript_24815/g.69027  ORF Transcript_24815/g.69027 Transcript_24815/m.69027 type:complete len:212 (-) Transcript_24815:485-1120(-)|eukprot:CAMPEP_0198133600 /NCGR_PEP_ID=MMETSP1442-20131203/59650_1 /TAXON_ID= /ORGANISM="Craspedostauros australis, Strain CCMP3328" /LENGTH=211 /DNA_ID=CAMNT_0043794725 /DNA_START=234 /DNA_END=869 /DNA_ORIENTATION=-